MTFEKKVKKFVKENFDLKCKVGEEFYALPYHKTQVVYFPTNVEVMKNSEFMENYTKIYEDTPKADEFIISLLHEVGHCMTSHNMPTEVTKLYAMRVIAFEQGIEDIDYFNLPQEQLATDFAYTWIKKHPKKIKRFWKAIKSDLRNMGYFEE